MGLVVNVLLNNYDLKCLYNHTLETGKFVIKELCTIRSAVDIDGYCYNGLGFEQ